MACPLASHIRGISVSSSQFAGSRLAAPAGSSTRRCVDRIPPRVCGGVTSFTSNGGFVWLPQTMNSRVPSGESTTLCGPCSPLPGNAWSFSTASRVSSPSESLTR